jgi:hypothetical protein
VIRKGLPILKPFLNSIFEAICQHLDNFWRDPNRGIQCTVCQIIYAVFEADWVINQTPILDWIREVIPNCVTLFHVQILGLLDQISGTKEPVELIWKCLHKDGIEDVVIPYCFQSLEKLVKSQPELIQYCDLADIIQGLQIKDSIAVRACVSLLKGMVKSGVGDCGLIFQASVSAIQNWPIYRWEKGLRFEICQLWYFLIKRSGDTNGCIEWAVGVIEKKVGRGEISELRMLFQSFTRDKVPKGFQGFTEQLITKFVEHFQVREG